MKEQERTKKKKQKKKKTKNMVKKAMGFYFKNFIISSFIN